MCDKSYIGQTAKPLDVRISQHKRSVTRSELSNAIAVHVSTENHLVDWLQVSSILHCNNYTNRNITESAIIQLTKDNNLNKSEGTFSIDNLLLSMFYRDMRAIVDGITGSPPLPP